MLSYSGLDFFPFSPWLWLLPHSDIFLLLGRRADINVYGIKSICASPPCCFLFSVAGPSVLFPPPFSVCLVHGQHGENQAGKCSSKNGALQSRAGTMFPLLFSLLPGEGLSHADSECPCPHHPRQTQPSGRKRCPPHLTRRAGGLLHTGLIADVLPGSAHLLAEDQEGRIPQHSNRHTAAWRKPEREGHKTVP